LSQEIPTYEGVLKAKDVLEGVIEVTPFQFNQNLSDVYGAQIFLKREDLQVVRSYKIRGAYNFIASLSEEDRSRGVACSSAGNHAQGVALACYILGIKGVIFMPTTTPKQKIRAVERIGKDKVEIVLSGDTYDDAKHAALKYAHKHGMVIVSPFDDKLIVEGQGTVGVEVAHQLKKTKPDYIFVPVGGGGLIAGLIIYLKKKFPKVKIIGVEPQGAPAMFESLKQGEVITLGEIDRFVDGAAVKQVGQVTFKVCQHGLDDMILVPEGRVCTTILQLYNNDAIVAEPAGALAIAALSYYREQIKGKNVVCILSGGNNDIERMPEIKERSLIFEGLKHYFMITFPQRSGALKEFVNKVLGPDDDITLFEYTKKNTKESGPALVGIELKQQEDYQPLLNRMQKYGVKYTLVNEDPVLFSFLI
jgi:threonine dehydratase